MRATGSNSSTTKMTSKSLRRHSTASYCRRCGRDDARFSAISSCLRLIPRDRLRMESLTLVQHNSHPEELRWRLHSKEGLFFSTLFVPKAPISLTA